MIPIRDDNPTRTTPVVTVLLIGGCVLVYLWQISLGEGQRAATQYSLGFIPALLFDHKVLAPELYRIPATLSIVTSMFLHGGLLHLLGNMLYLWIFGNNVEDAMGHGRFVLFYLVCGTAAALTQALPAPDSTIPLIGASGAIAGVLGAYLLLHPYARVLVVIPLGFIIYPIYLPAVLVLGIWFVLQLLSSLGAAPGQGGVAWYAHIGGFITGLLLTPLLRRRGVPLWAPR